MKMARNVRERIVVKLKQLAGDPTASNLDVKKLSGREGYRLRVGDYRIIYEMKDDELVIIVIRKCV